MIYIELLIIVKSTLFGGDRVVICLSGLRCVLAWLWDSL